MLTENLNYELPAELIAQKPADQRSRSRLLVLGRENGHVQDRGFTDICEYTQQADCLVLNDTKVLAARFFAKRKTGARLEGLLLGKTTAGPWEVMLKNAGRVKEAETLIICDKVGGDFCQAKVFRRIGGGRWLLDVQNEANLEEILSQIGFAPLPPYIKRGTDPDVAKIDLQRYQTVYAANPGAVAAPTAGLHFTRELIQKLKGRGVCFAYVTLHVGAGTFKPVTAANLEDHDMHSESYSISPADADMINETPQKGGRIIAVGTTTVRTLEAVAGDGYIRPGRGDTKLFIQPGYEFKVVDGMVTNFHLPRSTLLALVGAFAGLENVLAAYKHAIEQRYRFYSYGDAMLIV